ncbi:unnamed protein product [Orchesella dallaii]|uniref:Uncharacterized protein n=1 Tax=Orchesella dallaii TaxID=48710 RepID=A0ABP1PTT0_9HEXA
MASPFIVSTLAEVEINSQIQISEAGSVFTEPSSSTQSNPTDNDNIGDGIINFVTETISNNTVCDHRTVSESISGTKDQDTNNNKTSDDISITPFDEMRKVSTVAFDPDWPVSYAYSSLEFTGMERKQAAHPVWTFYPLVTKTLYPQISSTSCRYLHLSWNGRGKPIKWKHLCKRSCSVAADGTLPRDKDDDDKEMGMDAEIVDLCTRATTLNEDDDNDGSDQSQEDEEGEIERCTPPPKRSKKIQSE